MLEQRTHPEVIRIPSVFLTRNSGWIEGAKNGSYEEGAGGASPLPSIGPHSLATMPKGIKTPRIELTSSPALSKPRGTGCGTVFEPFRRTGTQGAV